MCVTSLLLVSNVFTAHIKTSQFMKSGQYSHNYSFELKFPKKLKMIPLCWKVFAILAIGKPFFENSEGVLRNPVTDRCLHLGYNSGIKNDGISVFVDQCSFTDVETGKKGNRDQWVEIVPVSPGKKTQDLMIRKFSTNDLLCVQTENNSITVGNCYAANSIFHFKPLANVTSFSSQVFTIEQPSGKCLTVQPGNERLGLDNCSDTNPFQRWIACRHINACDVEISWSPARIIFPKDPFNKSSDLQDQNLPDVEPIITSSSEAELVQSSTAKSSTPKMAPLTSTPNIISSTFAPKVIFNEPLYFIYNSLIMERILEPELVKVVAEFYKKVELEQALEILQDEFSLEIDPRTKAVKKSLQLTNWVRQIVSNGLNYGVVFASKNMSRVPSTSHLNLPVSNTDLVPCPNVSAVKNKIEAHFNTMSQTMVSLKSKVLSELNEIINEYSTPSRMQPTMDQHHRSSEDTSNSEEDMSNIDIRVMGSKTHKPLFSKHAPLASPMM